MTTTPTPLRMAEISAELDAINGRLLDAMARYVRERSKESFDEWLAINREYVATHRRWWALASPDVPYESVLRSDGAMSDELDRIPRKVRVAVESCLWALLPLSVPERMQVLDYLRERMPVAPTPSFAPPWRPVEIWYPGIAGNSAGIEVSIEDVRAARSIRVHYDFDRDGFAITAQRDPGDGEWDAEKEDNEPWLEVAFVPAWYREAAR